MSENYRQIYVAELVDKDDDFDVRVTTHYVEREYGKLHVSSYPLDFIYPVRKKGEDRRVDMSGYSVIGPARVGSFCDAKYFYSWDEKEALEGAQRLLENRIEKLKRQVASLNEKIKVAKSEKIKAVKAASRRRRR